MPKKNSRNTKSKIVDAAWRLFYEQGYDDTTVEDIIEESGTSKGSFYHYFAGKDALLSSLSYLFDEKYEEIEEEIDPEMGSFEKLMYYNEQLFGMIETVSQSIFLQGFILPSLSQKAKSIFLTEAEHIINFFGLPLKKVRKPANFATTLQPAKS